MSHRHLRFLAILAIVLAGSIGAVHSFDAPSVVIADEHEGEAIIRLPLRWCAVEGSPAGGDPSTINDVLLERQARANDLVWLPGAEIEFRSALTSSESFPTVADPSPDPGAPGDIVDPRDDPSELSEAIANCREQWDFRTRDTGNSIPGPIALNIGTFVDENGNPTGLGGWGGYTTWAPKTEHPCDAQSELVTASGGFIAVQDFQVAGNPEEDAHLVAHELGHVLLLSHGDGLDDDDDGFYDQRCDPWELPPPTANTVMHPDILAATDVITTLQRDTSRDIAYAYTGSQIDSSVGPTLSDERADTGGDVGVPSVDLTYVELVQNLGHEKVTLTHGLLGLVYPDETNEYFTFIDLNNDPNTGGNPGQDESLQPLTQFDEIETVTEVTGIELVIRVVVEPDRRASVAAWRFNDLQGVFEDVTDQGVEVQLTSPEGGEEPTPLFDVVTINLDLGITNTIEEQVNIQTVATDGAHLDVLSGDEGSGPSDQSVPLYIVAPELPDEG